MPCQPSVSECVRVERALVANQEPIRCRVMERMGRHLRPLADPEDIVASAVRSAIGHLRKGEAMPSATNGLLGYTIRVALNKVATLGRKLKRERRSPSPTAATARPLVESLPAHGPGPTQLLAAKEREEILAWAIRQLEPEDQEAIRNRCYLGLKGEDLGKSLGLSASAACHRVVRAVERLRQVVKRWGEQHARAPG